MRVLLRLVRRRDKVFRRLSRDSRTAGYAQAGGEAAAGDRRSVASVLKLILRLFTALLIIAAVAAALLLPEPAYSLDGFDAFVDVADHWARDVLERAYHDGLIVGYEGSLFPDGSVSAAQAYTILNRMLGATAKADISSLGLSGGEWYHDDVSKAAYLGTYSAKNNTDLNAPLSRQDAFAMLAEAFQLAEAKPDLSALTAFTDSGMIDAANVTAMAALVSKGLLGGSGGMLSPAKATTRAEFLTAAYRIADLSMSDSAVKIDTAKGVMHRGSAALSDSSFRGGIWFDCSSSEISLQNVYAQSVTIRSHELKSLDLSGNTKIGRLILAAQSGDTYIATGNGSIVEVLVVGSGAGDVVCSGVGTIEITGSGRSITINSNAAKVVVTGANNTIYIPPRMKVGTIELLGSAGGTRVITDGSADVIDVSCSGAQLTGAGVVRTLVFSQPGTVAAVRHENIVDAADYGLLGASVSVNTIDRLPAGRELRATATINDALPGTTCAMTWYVDGSAVMHAAIVTGEIPPTLVHSYEYDRFMRRSSVIKVEISYTTNLGDYREISDEATVNLDNYNIEYYTRRDAEWVLEKVTLGYKGNYTLAWAEANDLSAYEKEVWVNAKGYKSKTAYMIWINLAYQRVNIFEGSEHNWELIRSCIVGTGGPGHGTATGVCATTYKQIAGWTTSRYTCRPVVRFREGTGYAFHSRLYYPGSDRLTDDRIGFPVSAGCIRMYDEDIWYIFDNIPEGTTVVIH